MPQLSTTTATLATDSPVETVPLAYERYMPTQAPEPTPLVILHGLFGSKQNWRSLARGLAQRLSVPIYALDLRNHGDSPHSASMNYRAMAADVERFIDEQKLKRVTLMGHSMGAHVVMTLALSARVQDRPSYLERVILVDKAPRDMALDRAFSKYVHGMQLVDQAGVERQSDADTLLAPYVPVRFVNTPFLLTNLKRDTTNDESRQYRFRVPLNPFQQSTLFVAGSKSNYVRPQDHLGIRALFPKADIEYLETGHWVQAEKPMDFMQLVTNFYKQKY
ncbi:Alpha/Beta hydrolase protein [Syncephalis fuscata]|nr:Alpha/Beta hydrolase protein [Syncephalis fuscata]